jgi:hypothetical protein
MHLCSGGGGQNPVIFFASDVQALIQTPHFIYRRGTKFLRPACQQNFNPRFWLQESLFPANPLTIAHFKGHTSLK